MRIIVPHNKSREEVMQTVDRSLNDLFQKSLPVPVQFVETHRSWQGSTLSFSLAAKMGIINVPVKGTVEVGDRDIIIDVDLGMLERLIPADKARDMIGSRVRGLLK
jgi:hypothetical protein